MVIWEIIIIMVVATICLWIGTSAIADGILNAVDRYKSKRTVKEMKVFSEIMKVIPETMVQVVDVMKKKIEQDE